MKFLFLIFFPLAAIAHEPIELPPLDPNEEFVIEDVQESEFLNCERLLIDPELKRAPEFLTSEL